MKELTNKCKIAILIALIIIIAGIIVITTKGFKFDLNYEAVKQVEILIGKEFNKTDIQQITNEIFGQEAVLIQKVEVYEDMVSIKALDITEEQKTKIVEKINEKYQMELKTEDVEIKSIPHTRARDILKSYVTPFIITMVIVLVYMAIRFRKLGAIKTILKTVFITIVTQLVLISLIAIIRVPLGSTILPMIVFLYIITIFITTTKFEKQLKNKILETN